MFSGVITWWHLYTAYCSSCVCTQLTCMLNIRNLKQRWGWVKSSEYEQDVGTNCSLLRRRPGPRAVKRNDVLRPLLNTSPLHEERRRIHKNSLTHDDRLIQTVDVVDWNHGTSTSGSSSVSSAKWDLDQLWSGLRLRSFQDPSSALISTWRHWDRLTWRQETLNQAAGDSTKTSQRSLLKATQFTWRTDTSESQTWTDKNHLIVHWQTVSDEVTL